MTFAHWTDQEEPAGCNRCQKSEALFKALIESSPDGVVVIDKNGAISHMNAPFVRMWRLPEALMAVPDHHQVLAHLSRQLESPKDILPGPGVPYELKDVIRCKDGRCYERLYCPPAKGVSYGGTVWRFRDVSEWEMARVEMKQALAIRTKNEQALKNAHNKIEEIVASVPDIIFRLDPDGRFSFLSKAVKKYGYDSKELIGRHFTEVFRDEDKYNAGNLFSESANSIGRTNVFEIRVKRKDGSTVPFEIYSRGIYRDAEKDSGRGSEDGSAGRVFYGIQGVARDRTQRNQARRERQILATAVKQTNDAILIINPEGFIDYVNPAFKRLTGYSPQQTIGAAIASYTQDKSINQFFAKVESVVKQSKPWNGRLLNRKPDEQALVIQAAVYPVSDDRGAIINYVALAQDATREARLENQFRQTQKMEALGTLAGGIAHDFNNILGVIIGQTELMKIFNVAKESPLYNRLEEVHKAAHRAKDLVDQILAFSRQTEHEKRSVYPEVIVKEALKFLRASIPATIELRGNIENKHLAVMSDPTQLHQILMNLCTNAAQAMEDTGGVLEVGLAETVLDEEGAKAYLKLKPGRYLVMTVRDTGHGMTPEIKQKIFDPYFTTKGEGQGTGLGLAVVHGIVSYLGGDIRVRSEPGTGSIFTILLPAHEEDNPAAFEEIESPIAGGDETILLIDDEDGLLAVERDLLESLGYIVFTCHSAREALNIFRSQPDLFDLVITDHTLPQMTGIEIAAELIRIRPDIPIILCTGFRKRETWARAVSIGIRACLDKPLNLHEAATIIRKVLDRNHTEQLRVYATG